MSLSAEPSVSTAAAITTWVDAVFAEAGVQGDAPLKREIANRLASLITLGPLTVYALDHDGKSFSRWLVEEDQDRALDRIDEAFGVVAGLAAEQSGDAPTHLEALGVVLAGVFEEQFGAWVAGVKADYGA